MFDFSRTLILAGVISGLGSCAAVQGIINPNGAMEGKVAEVRGLRLELQNSWEQVEKRVTQAESSVENFGSGDQGLSPSDLRLVQAAVEHRSELAEQVLANPGLGAEAADAAYTGSTGAVSSEVKRVSDEAMGIYSNLHTGIPADLVDVTAKAKDLVVKSGVIHASAAALKSTSESNFLMTSAEEEKFSNTRNELDKEIAALKELSSKIISSSGTMSARLTGASAKLQGKLSKLGSGN